MVKGPAGKSEDPKELYADFWLIKRYTRHKAIQRCIASRDIKYTIEARREDGREKATTGVTCCGGERHGPL